jgi:hypothetical protein
MGQQTQRTLHAAIEHDLQCQDCGYNLRGLTGDRCPECGRSLRSMRSPVSSIPWTHRKEIGRFRAYWKTVWWVSFKYKTFCEEIARPVSFKDAQAFRWVTILHVFPPIAAVAVVWCVRALPSYIDRVIWWNDPWSSAIPMPSRFVLALSRLVSHVPWNAAFVSLAILLYMVIATGVPSYFFDSRQLPRLLRNRAVALSYYCFGAWAWTPVFGALWLVDWYLWVRLGWWTRAAEWYGGGLALFLMFMHFVQILDWYLNLLRTSRRLLPENRGRRACLAVGLPVLWLLAPLPILAGLACVVALVLAMVKLGSGLF